MAVPGFPFHLTLKKREFGSHLKMSLSSLLRRPRRNRRTAALRGLVRETVLRSEQLILPLFVVEGEAVESPIQGGRRFWFPLVLMVE